MKLLGSTESKVTKDGNGENVPYLKITEVAIVYCNFVNNNYQQDLLICSKQTIWSFIRNITKVISF